MSGLCLVCELFMKNQTSEATLVFFRSFGRIEVKAVKAGCWYVAALIGGINGPVAVIGMLALEVDAPGSAFSESDRRARFGAGPPAWEARFRDVDDVAEG